MAKLTLLEMVQNILSSMDSDDVNSITDTVESQQVADTVKECFFSLMTERDWPFLKGKVTLTALGDITKPTYMLMGAEVSKMLWVRYNKKECFYLPPDEFQATLDSRTVAAGAVNSEGYVINADPQYWTTFDDSYVVFDGFNSVVENTLQASKCTAYAVNSPSWTHTDSFVPAIPAKFFPTFLAESKATCFLNFKQQANGREETKAKRGRSRMQNESWRADAGESKYNSKVNYGRHS